MSARLCALSLLGDRLVHLSSPGCEAAPSGALLPGAARAVEMDGDKRLRRDPAARSQSAAPAQEAGWKPLGGREEATPLGPPHRRVRGDTCGGRAIHCKVLTGSSLPLNADPQNQEAISLSLGLLVRGSAMPLTGTPHRSTARSQASSKAAPPRRGGTIPVTVRLDPPRCDRLKRSVTRQLFPAISARGST